MHTFARFRLGLVLSIGFVAAACGDSRQSPGGPSPVAVASTAPASGNSTAFGGFSSLQSAADSEDVEGEGRVTSLVAGTVCPTLQFVVEGITVTATAATLYERGTCADLQPGVLVHVKGTSQTDGTVAALVRIQQNKVEGEGRIASVVSGTVCPALTFVVDSVTVTTDATTVYERGTCASLQPGVHVHVRGTRRENDTVLASLVRTQD